VVAFQPVRQWAGRLANRVVYGRRATPYQVLSDFARRIGGTYSAEGVLPQMAQTVAAGTGAEQVVVWLRVDDELRPEASSDGSLYAGPLPDADMSAPVVHQGELLGATSLLTRTRRRPDRFSASSRQTPRARWRTCATWPGASTRRSWPTWDLPQR
jgi:hypothetical protein